MSTRMRPPASGAATFRRSFLATATTALTTFFMISMATLAHASSVAVSVVDVTAPTGSVTLAPGASGAITINLSVSGNQDGTATFEVYRNWTLSGGTFSGSNPQEFTVQPRNGGDPATSFQTSGTVSVASGQADGTFTLSVGVFDITNSNQTGGKLAAGSNASYSVTVLTPAPSDSTPPVITPSVTGTLGDNGWYTSDVSVSWSVVDADSTVSSSTGCGSSTIDTDTVGTTLTCSATSAGGTASNSVTIKRDATAPTIQASADPVPNGSGFNNIAVEVSYVCADAMSGLASTCAGTDLADSDGTHQFDHTISDLAGNSASVGTTVRIDRAGPSISGTAAPAANVDGWNNTDVTVTFDCFDDGDGASGIESCLADGGSGASKTVSSEGAGQSVGGTATDRAGNSNTATVSGINIDKTPPQIELASRTPANGNGWNDGDVTVTWTCSDALSGVVDATASDVVSTEGVDQSATGICTDRAGNTASATEYGINIDTTDPIITFSDRTPAANGYGWNSGDVTVTWTCSDDGGSGVIMGSDSGSTIGEGADQELTGTCEDLAGNTARDTYAGIDVDKTAPTASASASPAPNTNGWNKTDVTVSFSGSDALSGIASCDDDVVLDVEAAGQSASGTCTDKAGNVSDPASVTDIDIDKTAPTNVAFSGGGIADGGTYYFGFVPAGPSTCSADDALSGVAGCAVTGGGTSVGSHVYTATATDNADNASERHLSYQVRAWTLRGFYAPVDMNGVLNTVKNGSTVPLKFEIFAGSTELTDVAYVKSLSAAQVTCDLSSGTDELEVTATGGTSLRYDSTGGQFVYNWKTPNQAGKCYRVTMTTQDLSTIVAYFKLK